MQAINNDLKTLYLNDISHHIEGLKNSLYTLQIDCTKERNTYSLCEKALQKTYIVEKIITTTNLDLPFKIATEVNRLFIIDENLSSVYVKIINSKRLFHADRIANLKITI
jgi:hypothetical protein